MGASGTLVDMDLADLYAQHRGTVYAYLLARCRDPDLAEDLTQDTYLRALRGSYEDRGKPRAWLCTIAVRLLADHRKSATSRRETVGRQPIEGGSTLPGWAADEPSPETLAVEAETRANVRATVRRLLAAAPARYRQVLWLRFGRELTSQQAAQEMGLAGPALRMLQSRALKRLRDAAESNGSTDGERVEQHATSRR